MGVSLTETPKTSVPSPNWTYPADGSGLTLVTQVVVLISLHLHTVCVLPDLQHRVNIQVNI